VTFRDDAQRYLAPNVTHLRLNFLTVEAGYTGYSEIDVFSVPEASSKLLLVLGGLLPGLIASLRHAAYRSAPHLVQWENGPCDRRLCGLVLAALITTVLSTGKTAHATPIPDGLIGYWPADGNGNDLSGFGRNVTLNGGLGFGAGLAGQAFDFHSNNAQFAVRTVDDAAFDFGASNFTLQVWVNLNNFSGEHTLIEKFTGPGGNGWTLTERSGPSLHFFANGSPILDTGLGVPLAGFTANAWHDIVVRRRSSAFELFFDGVLVKSNSSLNPNINTDQPLRIGNRQGTQPFPLNGRIDEAAIWNRALTDAEITTLFHASVPEPSSSAMFTLALVMLGRLQTASAVARLSNQRT
jgi:hypothetical protein